jgi:hypothetical protein
MYIVRGIVLKSPVVIVHRKPEDPEKTELINKHWYSIEYGTIQWFIRTD